MRVALLTTSFPRGEGDVPGQFVLGFARALAACGHQLRVLAPEPAEPEFVAPPHFSGIELTWLRYLPQRHWQRAFYGAGVLDNVRRDPRSALGLAPFVLRMWREAQRAAPQLDAVVSHWALPCALVAGALRPRLTHLAVLHSADVFLLERLPGRTALARHIVAGADALLFSSRELRGRFLALLPAVQRGQVAGRCHVCAMGIEPHAPLTEARAALRARLGLRRFTLLSLGRLIALKGVAHAIDAVAATDGVELIVAGAGPEAEALRAHARARNAAVRFAGELRGIAKSELLHAADAFVLPSIVLPSGRSEGMPTTLLEAMEYGLPVIASDVGGVSDVVRDGENGWLVAPADPAALADALARLRDDALRERLAQGARETAALYHWNELGPRLSELLEA
ncbi:MAG TPA: glycosyltransferase family 4 protein [Polyangiales bacterium]